MDPRGFVPKRSTFGITKKCTKRYDHNTREIENKKGKIRWTHAGWCRNAQRLVPRAQKDIIKARPKNN